MPFTRPISPLPKKRSTHARYNSGPTPGDAIRDLVRLVSEDEIAAAMFFETDPTEAFARELKHAKIPAFVVVDAGCDK
jgi:hypothetical protein